MKNSVLLQSLQRRGVGGAPAANPTCQLELTEEGRETAGRVVGRGGRVGKATKIQQYVLDPEPGSWC